ncbi:MAG: hypothetical protein WDN45_15865 [Caulobacteraceae bacterium]
MRAIAVCWPWAMERRGLFIVGFLAVVVLSAGLTPFLGSNFFPSVDSGQITLHMRPRVGTRIEDASAEFGRAEALIRQVIPANELASIVGQHRPAHQRHQHDLQQTPA